VTGFERSNNHRGRGAGEPRLELRGITKAFGDVTVLQAVSLQLARGEIHGLLGQNGAGKSTLTRVLAGGYPDYQGTVHIDGQLAEMRSPHASQKHGVAVIYQEFSLVRQLTVAENILLGVEPDRVAYRGKVVRNHAARLLDEVGMADEVPLDAVVAGLSTSMQQRVEIAKALSRNAKVLILDEPTSRLGGAEREHLFALMRRIAAGGTAMVFISHFLEEVLAVTSRLTVLRDGSVVADGPSSNYDSASLGSALLGHALEQREAVEAHKSESRRGAALLSASGLACGHRVKGVSLTVHAGEIVGVAGLVGSGRTTLAKALVGAVRVDAGVVECHGRPVRFKSPKQALKAGVALVPEDRRAQGLIGVLSASENVVLMSLAKRPSKFGFVSPGGLRTTAMRAIEQFEVRPAEEDRRGSLFSGGNQQKLVLARAILADTDVLVIDQPTAGVDVGTKAQIHRILRAAADDGKAILCISDEIDELLALSDRLVVMRDGRLIAECNRGEVGREELITMMSARAANAA
jgi:ABC-type sugar transport system ATPase subunit